ncbi:hypothetical protein ABZ829_12080 [Streptomyces xanthochromogenes]|uniref:hypothetical protein n=1 Tax=Streptomyces xanthochromogenes TaxID=67384 RepID=UPI003425F86C
MSAVSPFFRAFGLAERGVELLHAEASYAHTLDGTRSAVAYRDLERTCRVLGADGARRRALMKPLVEHTDAVTELLLSGPRALPAAWPAVLQLVPHGSTARPV